MFKCQNWININKQTKILKNLISKNNSFINKLINFKFKINKTK